MAPTRPISCTCNLPNLGRIRFCTWSLNFIPAIGLTVISPSSAALANTRLSTAKYWRIVEGFRLAFCSGSISRSSIVIFFTSQSKIFSSRGNRCCLIALTTPWRRLLLLTVSSSIRFKYQLSSWPTVVNSLLCS